MTITCIAVNAAGLRIMVSDLISNNVLETIQTLAEADSVEIEIISIGSLPAMDALRQNEVSLAVVATPENDALTDDTFQSFPFAYSAAVVAVNKANPINEVSFYDLRGIFGPDSDLSIGTWSSLGVQSLADRLIKPLIMLDDKGISSELFRYTALEGETMKLTVNEVIKTEIEEMLSNDVVSVAVLPYLPDTKTIKVLMISVDPDSPAFGPTENNVYYGDYPIRLPFQIAYRKDHESELKKILSILLSDEVADVLRNSHLFVPPAAIRTSFVDGFDLIE